jgi:hypothetical protein
MDFFLIFFLLFPEDADVTVLFWSASSDRPCIIIKCGQHVMEIVILIDLYQLIQTYSQSNIYIF